MPEDVKLNNPTITVTMTFEKEASPNVESLVDVANSFLQYNRRLCQIPTKIGKKAKDWDFVPPLNSPIDPTTMIRILNVSLDTKEECWKENS